MCSYQQLHVTDTDRASPIARHYLELQNKWPLFNTKSSFFRGNSPLSLRIQWKTQKTVGQLDCNSQYLYVAAVDTGCRCDIKLQMVVDQLGTR